MLKIQFDTDTAAFLDPDGQPNDYYRFDEIECILERIITKIHDGFNEGAVMDLNGGRIGEWSLS